MPNVKRRIFILGGLGAAGAIALPGAASAAPYPFRLGVASGDPTPDGVVLWTRLAPSPLNADGFGGMPTADVVVEWQVSTTPTFTSLVQSGSVVARRASAHSVHVELVGLAPATEYYYRFRTQGHISPVGHTRTAPALGTMASSLTMAVASCAHFPTGWFTAYRRIAEENPGLVLHLGDYLYESAGTGVRTHSPASEIFTLANYRVRHAQVKTDPDLQAAHAVAPWLVVWDDHEVENNYAGLIKQDANDGVDFRARRQAAYQAYYEHMPLRAPQLPVAENMQLYRRIRWGQLATFHMLDTRQYRADQACGDGTKVCAEADNPARSITGAAQEAWLLDGLGQHLGTWDVIGQQVFFASRLADAAGATSMDAWDGYRASRNRIQQGMVARAVPNPVVLTGDVHAAWACDLKLNYASTSSPPIGVELVATSITSGGDGSEGDYSGWIARNPHIKFGNSRRGYLKVTLTPTQMRADFRRLTAVTVRDAPVNTVRSFVVPAGQPGLLPA
jgi:alkaline phosphatase D